MINETPLADAAETFLAMAGRADSSTRMYRSILERWLALAQAEGLQTVGDLHDDHASLLHVKVKTVVRGRSDDTARGHPPTPATRRLWRAVLREFWDYLILQGANLSVGRAGAYMKIEHNSPEPELPATVLTMALEIAQTETGTVYDLDQKNGQEQHLIALRNYALLLTLNRTGMRVSEVLNLRRGDIEWSQRPIRARITGKGRKDRRVYFDEETRHALRKYLAARDAAGESSGGLANQPLFVGHNHRNPGRAAISPQTVWRIVRELGRKAAADLKLEQSEGDEEETFSDLHPHHMRHAFATNVWKQSGDLHLAQQLLGHASPATTARYTHADDEDLASRYVSVMNAGRPDKKRTPVNKPTDDDNENS